MAASAERARRARIRHRDGQRPPRPAALLEDGRAAVRGRFTQCLGSCLAPRALRRMRRTPRRRARARSSRSSRSRRLRGPGPSVRARGLRRSARVAVGEPGDHLCEGRPASEAAIAAAAPPPGLGGSAATASIQAGERGIEGGTRVTCHRAYLSGEGMSECSGIHDGSKHQWAGSARWSKSKDDTILHALRNRVTCRSCRASSPEFSRPASCTSATGSARSRTGSRSSRRYECIYLRRGPPRHHRQVRAGHAGAAHPGHGDRPAGLGDRPGARRSCSCSRTCRSTPSCSGC